MFAGAEPARKRFPLDIRARPDFNGAAQTGGRMRVFYSEEHRLHFPQGELHGGELVTPFERPSRVG